MGIQESVSDVQSFTAQDFIMNTPVEQKNFGRAPDKIYAASAKKLHMLECAMSLYREGSEVSLLNRFAGESAVNVKSDMLTVLEGRRGRKQTAVL
ncbi:MAG: FAD:protein FMN transferase [Clostridiales bacterium]|nr:FAD:protein FMN transferase [Clostridiales bacterium]